MSGLKLYISSNSHHAAKWKKLRSAGANIIATWIDRYENETGALTVDFTNMAQESFDEIRRANKFILYCEAGEQLKSPLIEAGFALASGLRVYYVGPEDEIPMLVRFHRHWHNRKTVEEICLNPASE